MGPSLSSSNNVGILISTTADTAGSEQTDAALQSTNDELKGLGDTAVEVSGSLDDLDASFLSLGDSAEEYDANMQTIAAATSEAEGSITLLGDTTTVTSDLIIASNDATIASYREVADAATESAAQQGASAAGKDLAKGAASSVGLASAISSPYVLAGAAIAGAVALMVKSAADFQTQLTVLYDTAGETANYNQLSNAIQGVANATGATTKQLTSALYYISSAGYNTLSGVQILKAATEAAKEEGSDVTTVADALTTVMHDYGATASQSTSYMNQLLTAVSLGKTTLQDFSSALPTVLQVGKTAGLSFAQLAGSIATITENGTSANEATDELRSLIVGIITPTATASSTMQNLGLNVTSLAQNLGTEGLNGTLAEVTSAIAKFVEPSSGGLVLQQTLQNSTVATAKMTQEVKAMPPQLQTLTNKLTSGTISFADYRSEVQALPEGMTNLGKQFEGTYNQANSFNNLLTNGSSPAVQTFTGMLKTLFPNINATQAVLALTGQNAGTATTNIDKVAKSGDGASKSVQGWSTYQGTVNGQLGDLKSNAESAAEKIGNKLTPTIYDLLKGLNDLAKGFSDHATGITDVIETAVTMAFSPFLGTLVAIDKIIRDIPSDIKDLEHAFDSIKNEGSGFLSDIKALGNIPGFAGGVTNFAGGVATVGENGPERVFLPAGSTVKTNTQSSGSSAGGSGSSTNGVTIYQNNNNYSEFDLTTANKELGFMLANASPA